MDNNVKVLVNLRKDIEKYNNIDLTNKDLDKEYKHLNELISVISTIKKVSKVEDTVMVLLLLSFIFVPSTVLTINALVFSVLYLKTIIRFIFAGSISKLDSYTDYLDNILTIIDERKDELNNTLNYKEEDIKKENKKLIKLKKLRSMLKSYYNYEYEEESVKVLKRIK